MVPIVETEWRTEAEMKQLRRSLRKHRIPYVIASSYIPGRVLFVRESDEMRARQLVKEKFASFALIQHEKWAREWEREWRTKYKGSYWRWLTRRSVGRATMAGLSALWWFGL